MRFMRYSADECIIIAVNFSSHPAQMQITLPELSLSMAGVKPGQYRCTELLSGVTEKKTVDPTEQFITEVPANGATLWKFRTADTANNDIIEPQNKPDAANKQKKGE